MANYELIFSPTGGTQRVAELLGGSLWNDAEEIDLMDRALEEEQTKSFSDQDCCLVAVPCFGGRVPDPARRRLEELNGGGARRKSLSALSGPADAPQGNQCLYQLRQVCPDLPCGGH